MKGNIYLIGFMAAGKTTVGRLLSEELGWRFVDLDETIERETGRSVTEIFRESGEPHFRRLEREALRAVAIADRTVVALGGGSYVDADNRRLAHDTGTCIFLDTPLDQILDRLSDHESRPLVTNAEALRRLLDSRLPAYLDSDLQIPGTGSPEGVVKSILQRLAVQKAE